MRIAQGCCASNRPALVGHFPGHSIVSGVALLNEVPLAVERHFGFSMARCSWPAVNFIAPLSQGERWCTPWVKQYARRLEHYCLLYPYNWFNFYELSDEAVESAVPVGNNAWAERRS